MLPGEHFVGAAMPAEAVTEPGGLTEQVADPSALKFPAWQAEGTAVLGGHEEPAGQVLQATTLPPGEYVPALQATQVFEVAEK
mmetsp:Transcript_26206/g.69598  ORF Transcript_26206/g.69598 Transcript_26206/m.69598 type:complete len:83 (-) Transcript_26206:760-1008(-)